MKVFPTIKVAVLESGRDLQKLGRIEESSKWQGMEGTPDLIELFGYSFKCPMPPKEYQLAEMSGADLPWAEDHFQERVSGIPSNPGESFRWWPFYVDETRENINHRGEGVFTHTYQERFWPRRAQIDGCDINGEVFHNRDTKENMGIRYRLGDLSDVVKQLKEHPTTRQAYLPIWFPEDTGVVHGGRVPCSLGYLFNIKGKYLHITYYIRSCDYMRHFRNDVYFTARLAQWMCDQLGGEYTPGFMFFHIASFHILDTDSIAFKKKLKDIQNEEPH
jgi:hypothetical protein